MITELFMPATGQVRDGTGAAQANVSRVSFYVKVIPALLLTVGGDIVYSQTPVSNHKCSLK